MPRADEPRVTVRFSEVDHAMLAAAADAAGVSLGSLVREGAMLHAAKLAGVSAREVKLRRRSAAAPVPSPAAPQNVLPDQMGEDLARANAKREAKTARTRAALGGMPGVKTGRELMLERQRKLNERRA